jgi:flagellin
MAVRNANDAISMVQTVDGALIEVEAMLQRMRELTVQAASGTMGTTDQAALNTEFRALEEQIQDISVDTEWNGIALLNGELGSVSFQVGANASQTIAVTFGDLNTDGGSASTTLAANTGLMVGLDLGTGTVSSGAGTATNDLKGAIITSSATHSTTLSYVDNAITRLNAHRATLGATINRLEYAADNLSNVSQNTSASRSRVMDADYASETTELARTQIIQQAGTAMLSQANQQAQSVLALLR